MVFRDDCKKAEEAFRALESGKLEYPQSTDGIIYIQTDGAALNTRLKDETGSTWRENKLGEVFTSKDIRYWTNSKGECQHQILSNIYKERIFYRKRRY
jgi:hypothetical protein